MTTKTEPTAEERAAYRDKLKSLQISTVVRSTYERTLDRVIDMPRDEFYRRKQQVADTPNLADL